MSNLQGGLPSDHRSEDATSQHWNVDYVAGSFILKNDNNSFKDRSLLGSTPPQTASDNGLNKTKKSLVEQQKQRIKASEASRRVAESQNMSEAPSKIVRRQSIVQKSQIEPRLTKQQTLSMDERSSATNKKIKIKVQRLQQHMLQLQERQKKLENQQAHVEQVLSRVQQKSQLFPKIQESPKPTKPRGTTCRLNSKLISLKLQNQTARRNSTFQQKQQLKQHIIELRELISTLKEEKKYQSVLPSKEIKESSGNPSQVLPSLEPQKLSPERFNKSGYYAEEPIKPYNVMENKSDPFVKTIPKELKTVYYNGASKSQGVGSKLVPINQQPIYDSRIDLQKDIFVPLYNDKQKIKTNPKASTDVLRNVKQDTRPTQFSKPHDTRYDTSKAMQHNRRPNVQLVADNSRPGRTFMHNPEEEDDSPIQRKNSRKPIFNTMGSRRESRVAERQEPRVEHREPRGIKQPYEPYRHKTTEPEQPQTPKIDVMNNAQDEIVVQEPIEEPANPGDISNIQIAQFRTSEDLNKNMVIFPKLPENFNPLMNSQDLIAMARELFLLFGHKIKQQSALAIRKYRNCVYFAYQNNHILWHYSGKFYIGGWMGDSREEGGKNGKGIEFIPQNYIYEGQFVNGKRQGFGVVNSVKGDNYVGQWLQGLRHGKGRLEQSNGMVYDGQWKNGKKDGFGKLTFKGIEQYEGTFENGLKQGFGREVYRNGDSYKGQYFMGRFSGQGTYKWANGAIYHGQFLNGMRHGKGMWKSNKAVNADTYEGQYQQDKKSGLGKYTWENGTTYEGYFHNDMKNGQGTVRYPDGTLVQGIWDKGILKEEIYNSRMATIKREQIPPVRREFREEPNKAVQFSHGFNF